MRVARIVAGLSAENGGIAGGEREVGEAGEAEGLAGV